MCKIRGVWLQRPLPSLNTDATSPMEMWLAYHFQSCECGLGRGRGRSNTLPLWAPSSREQAASASSLLKPECHAVRKPTRLPGQAYVGDEGGSQPRERAIWRVDSPGSPPSPPPLTPMPRPAGQCSFPHSPRKAKLGPNKRRLFPAAPPGVVCDAEMKTRRPFGMEKCTLL